MLLAYLVLAVNRNLYSNKGIVAIIKYVTSTSEIMGAMKEMRRDVIQAVLVSTAIAPQNYMADSLRNGDRIFVYDGLLGDSFR